jgi:hypothetical protein
MSGDRLAQAVICVVIAVLAWLLMLRAMTKPGAQRDPWTWVQILSSLAAIGYVLYLGILTQPGSVFHCTKHCFPWGD